MTIRTNTIVHGETELSISYDTLNDQYKRGSETFLLFNKVKDVQCKEEINTINEKNV